MNSRNFPSPARPLPIAISWLLALLLAPAAHAFIGEPETLVYGRILNRQNPNAEHLVTAGELRWTIQKPDGTSVVLSGDVDALDGGNYSYLLRIPHQAVMLGQQPVARTLPLGIAAATASHVTMTLDGSPAGILPPATSRFDLDQILRATTWRLDLEINTPAEDTDGDGMADWWEELHGLDKQNANDALTDLNGNGLNNRGEFLAGKNPKKDSRLPQLITSEVIAYSASTSILLLETADSDSTPAELSYTLRSLPDGGRLLLRNASADLAVGSAFTQADVNSGRLVFEHTPGETTGAFEVAVRDEDPSHAEAAGPVLVRLFDPAPDMVAANAVESLRLEAHRLASNHAHLVADLGAAAGKHQLSAPTAGLSASAYQAYAASFGAEIPHVLLGGPSDDLLAGGHADDFLHGGAGLDTFTGGAGSDTFLFTGVSAQTQVIADFNPAEGDVIDLGGVLNGTSTLLTDYVRIRRSGNDALVEISAAGTNTGFTDRVIRLSNSPLQGADVSNLHYGGNLETGAIGLPPRLAIAASVPTASENGPVNGVFTISREGNAEDSLLVSLIISGNATNGADYQNIPSSILIPAGETGVILSIRPYVDTAVEFNEVVRVELASSSAYTLAASKAADVVIEDLKPQITLEVFEGLACVAGPMPGSVLMRRGGLVSPEVFVQFTLSGTAVNGTDYNYVTPYVTFTSGQTTKLIEFMPKPTVNFGTADAKTIRMTVKPDASYASLVPGADLLIVPEKLTYESWLASSGPQQIPTEGDGSGADMPMLARYGFGMKPQQSFDAKTRARLPKPSMEDGYLTLRFRRKPGITDLRYQVEYSNDFIEWSSASTAVEDITSQVAPNDPGAAVFRSKKPMSASPTGAMRVRLTLPDAGSNP